jgi:peptidyl-Asp metalloendopeptidase
VAARRRELFCLLLVALFGGTAWAQSKPAPEKLVVQFKKQTSAAQIQQILGAYGMKSGAVVPKAGLHVIQTGPNADVQDLVTKLSGNANVTAAAPVIANLEIVQGLAVQQAPAGVRRRIDQLKAPGSVLGVGKALPYSIVSDVLEQKAVLPGAQARLPVAFDLAPDVRLAATHGSTSRVKNAYGESILWSAPAELRVRIGGEERLLRGNANFVFSPGETWGTIATPGGTYFVAPVGDGHQAAIRVNAQALPPDHPRAADKPPAIPDSGDVRISSEGNFNCPTGVLPVATDHLQLKLGIVYSRAALMAVLNNDQIFARPCAYLYSLIGSLNDAFRNSQLKMGFQIVATGIVNGYTEPQLAGQNSVTLTLGQALDTSKGLGKEIDRWRRKYKANIVVVLVSAKDGCGVADERIEKYDDSSRAIAVADSLCAATIRTATHEIGHVMGLRHDVKADNSSSPFPYGHGFVSRGKYYKFMTLMGTRYSCPDCDRVNYWSNPALTEPTENQVLGDAATANEARVLYQVAPTISRFFQ